MTWYNGITWHVGNANWRLHFKCYKEAKEFFMSITESDSSVKIFY